MKIKKGLLWLRCHFFRYLIKYWTKEIRSLQPYDKTLFYEYLEHCNPSHYRPTMKARLFKNGIESFTNDVLPRYIANLKQKEGFEWVHEFDQDQRPLLRILRSAFTNFEIIKESRQEAEEAEEAIRINSKSLDRKVTEEVLENLNATIREPERVENIMKRGKRIPSREWIFQKRFA